MNAIQTSTGRLEKLIQKYGEGADGSSPTRAQWNSLLQRPVDKPVTLVNFFKLREYAVYEGSASQKTGQDAFDKYAEISIPTVAKVGGQFLLVAPYEGMFIGQDQDWDLVAIGSYPSLDALLELVEDEDYTSVFHHRSAACEKQQVFICNG